MYDALCAGFVFQIEIKRVLESLYGFEVDKVRTLNMEGKKKKRGGLLVAKPDYKKAYVTLKSPLSMSQDLYPIRIVEEDRRSTIKESKSKSSIVEQGEARSHWLDGDKDAGGFKPERSSGSGGRGRNRSGDGPDTWMLAMEGVSSIYSLPPSQWTGED